MKRINEIFYSIQGEGYFTGTPAVFIRFSGCNLRCDFCDTQHQEAELMADKTILQLASEYPSRHVVLTGGEPGLQIDEPFVTLWKQAGWFVQVETNGTQPIPSNIDWVTCSPKERCILTEADELKIVYLGQDLSPFDHFSARVRYLQPCSMKNTSEVLKYVKEHPQWKLSVQLHRLLNIP